MNGRVDASYHVPIVDAIVEHLKKYAAEVTTIGDERISSDVILPGRFKRVMLTKDMEDFLSVESNSMNLTLLTKSIFL